jgi:hypothetical protein
MTPRRPNERLARKIGRLLLGILDDLWNPNLVVMHPASHRGGPHGDGKPNSRRHVAQGPLADLLAVGRHDQLYSPPTTRFAGVWRD